MAALHQLEAAYAALRHDPRFWAELRELLATFAGRPTPLYRADRLAEQVLERAGAAATGGAVPATLRLYLKREDVAHTGAHKINNALGQALLTRRLGKTRVIAETGAGQHGVATATACALLGLPCVVYMGAEDIERQQPNVLRMHALGAEVRAVTSGSATLKDAINDAMRDWVTNVESTHYVLGSAMGPHPYPTIVRDLQRRIGDEAAVQLEAVEGRLPDLALACVGGGSNAIGLLSRFIGEPSVRLAVAEAAGDGIATGRHAAALAGGSPGILHGARSMMLQDRDGQVVEAVSASAGLDYPGVGPQLSALHAAGRIELAAATDDDAFEAMALHRGDGGHPARARDGPRDRGAAAPPCRHGGERRAVSRPTRSSCSASPAAATRTSRRSGAGGSGTGRSAEHGTMTETAGGDRIREAFAAAAREGRAALVPYVVAGYPDLDTSYEAAIACIDAGADVLEVGLPYSDPLADGATLQRASSAALKAGATFDGSIELVRRIAESRSRVPLVPMCYANQVIGGGDGREAARRLADAGAAGIIVADLTPDEGGAVRGRRRRGGPRRRLPRRPDDATGATPRDRRALRRLPVLRLARRRDRRPDEPAVARRAAGPGRQGRLAGTGGRRVRRQPARPRAGAGEGRRGWRDRGLGARRRPWRGRSGRPRAREARPIASGGRRRRRSLRATLAA